MKTKEWQLVITRKQTGHYTLDVYVSKERAPNVFEQQHVTTMGAAKSSPVGQCIKLLERLIDLSKKVTGYEG